MKEIPLTRGYVALVDDEDFEWLAQWKWQAVKDTCTEAIYAVRSIRGTATPSGKGTIRMHREIMGLGYRDSHRVDHIDRSKTLDNRRSNLRIADASQNGANRRRNRNNASGFKGVWFHKPANRWIAAIKRNGRSTHVGSFGTPEAAHEAYVAAARKQWGEFARSE